METMKKAKVIAIIKSIERIPYTSIFFSLIKTLKLYLYYKPRFFINQSKNKETDIFKIHWINPNMIKYASECKKATIGEIKGGNWDIHKKKLSLVKNPNTDYITVDLSRNGESLFVNGTGKLSLVKNKIPVMVRARHKKWEKLKQELKEYGKTHQKKRLYQKAYHFDLEDIPYDYNEERVNIIKKHISLKEKTVLDIGAYFGLFCHELEKLDFKCLAIEANATRVYFMKKLRMANNDKFKIVNTPLFEFKKGKLINFDVILAINIFHHFLKYKQDYERLVDFLKRLRCKEMFFESHNPNEKQMVGAYKNYSPEEFARFIIENSCLEKYELLQEFENGRKLYKIYVIKNTKKTKGEEDKE